MKAWILVIALAGLAVGVHLLRQATRTESRATPRPSAAERSVAAATPAPLAPVAPGRPLRPAPVRPVEDEAAAPPEVKPTEEHAGSGATPTGEEVRDQLEASFVADAPAASGELARGLDDGVRAALPPGSVVRSLECRSSLCRVETAHHGLADYQDFVQRAFLAPDPARAVKGPVFASPPAEPTHGDVVVAVVFVGREGTMLPIPTERITP